MGNSSKDILIETALMFLWLGAHIAVLIVAILLLVRIF